MVRKAASCMAGENLNDKKSGYPHGLSGHVMSQEGQAVYGSLAISQ